MSSVKTVVANQLSDQELFSSILEHCELKEKTAQVAMPIVNASFVGFKRKELSASESGPFEAQNAASRVHQEEPSAPKKVFLGRPFLGLRGEPTAADLASPLRNRRLFG